MMFKDGDRSLLVLGEALVTLGPVLHGFQGQRVRQDESGEATDA